MMELKLLRQSDCCKKYELTTTSIIVNIIIITLDVLLFSMRLCILVHKGAFCCDLST